MARHKDVKKVVLAYSGGLDTSVILKWLQVEYGCEVVTFTADLGQGEELEPARRKAERAGVKFNDADLLGIPVRLTVDGRGLQNGIVEMKLRRNGDTGELALDNLVAEVEAVIAADKRVSHGQVVRVIDLVRAEGIYKFAINVLKPDK